MSLINFVGQIYDDMRETKSDIEKSLSEIQANINVTGSAYSFAQYTVNTLPNVSSFTVAYTTNGLKSGESTGNGTGCPVWYDINQNEWVTFYDNSIVQD